jgi:hypothetical protein
LQTRLFSHWSIPLKANFRFEAPTYFCSVELAQLELLEDLRGGEDAGVDDAGHGEGPAHNGADCREEVVERRPVLVVTHRDRVHVIPGKTTIISGVGLLLYGKAGFDSRLGGTPMEIPLLSSSS